MSKTRRILLPLSMALVGMSFLAGLYFGIMSWAEGLQVARDLFWAERWFVIPLIVGFGVQVALYTMLKFRLFVPVEAAERSGALTLAPGASAGVGVSGTTSTVAMVSCCVHHVTDVLPILGLTAAATFLGQYRVAFMWIALGTTMLGIMFMLYTLYRERQKVLRLSLILDAK